MAFKEFIKNNYKSVLDILGGASAPFLILVCEIAEGMIDNRQVAAAKDWFVQVANSEIRKGPRDPSVNQIFKHLEAQLKRMDGTQDYARENFSTRYILPDERLVIVDYQKGTKPLTKEDSKSGSMRFNLGYSSLEVQILEKGEYFMWEEEQDIPTSVIGTEMGSSSMPKPKDGSKPTLFTFSTEKLDTILTRGISRHIAECSQNGGRPNSCNSWKEGVDALFDMLTITPMD